MTTTITQGRREHLAVAIQHSTGPWTSRRAARVAADGGWAGHPDTARKDLRALAARGLIAPLPGPGNRAYVSTTAGAAA